MKKIICTAVSALALAAFADGVNSTEFGVLKVPSSAKDTIVSVPWLGSGTGSSESDDAVKVKDLILTAGLNANDQLFLYDNASKSYTKAWVLSNNAWVGAEIEIGGKSIPAGSDTDQITRGSALMLRRANPSAGFYIMGKPLELSQGAGADLANGSASAEVYTLVAPPKTTDTLDANTSFTWTNLKAGKDRLILGNLDGATGTKSYVWSGTQWKDATGGNTVPIPAGAGFWFTSKDDTKTGKKVTWSK